MAAGTFEACFCGFCPVARDSGVLFFAPWLANGVGFSIGRSTRVKMLALGTELPTPPAQDIAHSARGFVPRSWIGPALTFSGGRVDGVTTSPVLLLSPVTARDVPVVMYPPLGFLVRGMGSSVVI